MSSMTNKTAGLLVLPVRVMLRVLVISVIVSFPSVNAESFTIKIPVSCTGSSCQAVLSDMEGKELEGMELKVGTESFFEISLEGPGKKQYLVKLKDQDTVSRLFDRTEYRVTISSCIGEKGEILRTVSVQPLGTEEKSAALCFRNTDLSNVNDLREMEEPEVTQLSGARGVTDRESFLQTRNMQKSGDNGKDSDCTREKLPQTGSRYLWLTPWMAAAGGIMIAAGLRVKKKQKYGDR